MTRDSLGLVWPLRSDIASGRGIGYRPLKHWIEENWVDWDAMSKPWLEAEGFLNAAHAEVMQGMMARAGLAPGQRILDVGCGTGPSLMLAAEAVGVDGHVTGIDIAPPLLARAAERAPENVTLIEGDAGSYAYPQAAFDAIISHFGTMFFADTAAAFANLRSAAKDGARMTLAVWGRPPKNPWFGIPRKAAVARFPDLPPPDPDAPGPMRFADAEALLAILNGAGWEASAETIDLHLTPGESVEATARMLMTAVSTMLLAPVEPMDDDLAAIEAGIASEFAGFEVDGVVRVPAEIHYLTATAS
ncbi:MAG: class I SAM-dependent methyltransferase [Paracoccaceae bacterium]|nr:class I SAM-dependent methyltransferase [Paracoccaceae bacterium]